MEEIADGEAAADLGNEERGAGGGAHLAEGSVVLIEVEELRFAVGDAGLGVVDLRIDVAVDEDEVLPAGVVEVDEGVAPADVGNAGVGDAGLMRDVGEVEVAVVAIEGGVLVAEVGDGDADPAVVEVVAERRRPCWPARRLPR